MKKNQTKEFKRQITLLQNKVEEYKERENFQSSIKMDDIQNLNELTILSNDLYNEEVIAITTLSDCHVEEEVISSVVNGLNEYNLTIAKQRINRYFKRVLYMVNKSRKSGYKLDQIVVGFLGDFISGYIHEELQETNNLTPVQATLFAQELLISGIKFLADNGKFKKITIPCIPGNHGRTTQKKRFNSGYKNSYEFLMYHEIKRIFDITPGYEHINIIIAESEFIYLNLFGYLNIFSHGDHFKYQGGIGGIEVPMKKWVLRENSIAASNPSLNFSGIDMAWIAHWHQYLVGSKIRVNGSVIGYNSFARGHGFDPESPKMQFQLLDKKRGFTLNNPIYLIDF